MSRRTWDRAGIVAALRERLQTGRDLSSGWMRKNDNSLLQSAKLHFGSYSQALREAGIDPDSVRRVRRWSADRVIDELRRQHQSGLKLSYKAVEKRDPSLIRAAESYHPTYREALRAAGIDEAQAAGPARRRWTREAILDEIRQAHARGEDLSLRRFRVNHWGLVGAAEAHFGSYGKAVDAAGISYATVRHFRMRTEAEILAELRRRHRRGKDLSTAGMLRESRSLYRAAQHRFGSYRRAVEQAGIDYASVAQRMLEHWDRKRVLVGLRQLHAQGHSLAETQVIARNRKLVFAARRLFGSYGKAIEAAGFEYGQVRRAFVRVWNRNRVIRLLRDLYRQGSDMRMSRLEKEVPGLVAAALRLFGSYRQAVQAAGLKYPPLKNPGPWTAKRVLQALQERNASGGELRYSQLLRIDESLVLAARHYFGTYKSAVIEAGISYDVARARFRRRELRATLRDGTYQPPTSSRKLTWPAERILGELRELHQAGEQLHRSALNQRHATLLSAACRRFGSLELALRAADIPWAAAGRRWTPQLVLDELREANRLGKDLSASHLSRNNSPLYSAMLRLFGTHAKALEAAGLDPRSVLRRGPPYSAEEVLNLLRQVAHAAGTTRLTYAAVSHADRNLPRRADRRFGSLQAAVEAAGLSFEYRPPGRRSDLGHWTEQTVLDTLRSLQASGEDLRHRIIKQKSQSLFHAAKRLFGSYANAVRQAGINYWTMSQEHAAKERAAKERAAEEHSPEATDSQEPTCVPTWFEHPAPGAGIDAAALPTE